MSEARKTFLPPTAPDFAVAMDQVEERLFGLPVDLITKDPWKVDAEWLDPLAWEWSVDDWDSAWPEDKKRAVIFAAKEVHRYKGTRYGVIAALEALGYGRARITEGWELPRLGPGPATGSGVPLGLSWVLGGMEAALGVSETRNGGGQLGRTWTLGWPNVHWADYWVQVEKILPKTEMEYLRGRLAKLAPVRCRLRELATYGVRIELGSGVWTLGFDATLGAGTHELAPVSAGSGLEWTKYLMAESGIYLTTETGEVLVEG